MHKAGVIEGSHIIMLRKRPQPPQSKVEPVQRPTLSEIESAIRREADRQGREVRPATLARGAASTQLASRLEGLMLVCFSLRSLCRSPRFPRWPRLLAEQQPSQSVPTLLPNNRSHDLSV
jgi:hypothetical protein